MSNRVHFEVTMNDLWKSHWTNPKSMDGESKLRQHDNFHKQINAFRGLLENSEKKFSKDILYRMLRLLVKGVPQLRGSKRTPRDDETVPYVIDSLSKLQEALDTFKTQKRRGIQKEEVAHVVKYFQTFLNQLSGLDDYKRYFDERIYKCLYEYFYDPSQDTSVTTPEPVLPRLDLHNPAHSRTRELGVSDDTDSGNYSDELSPTQQRDIRSKILFEREGFQPSGHELPQKTLETDAREKWSWAVRELHATNKRWENLVKKDLLNIVDFEEESEKEVTHYPCRDQFVLVLRLCPDIFLKSYKCLELAKIWWTQANKCLKFHPVRNRDGQDFEQKSRPIRLKLKELQSSILVGEKNLQEFHHVLETTTSREKRAEELASNCEQLEELKTDAEQKYNQALHERRALVRRFEYAIKGTSKYFELKYQLKDHDRKVSECYNTLCVARYQFELSHEDFLVEVEVRPNFIRFTDHVKEMISDLKETVRKLKSDKRQCDKELALIKTNCETMKSVMRQPIGDSKSTATPRGQPSKGRKQVKGNPRDDTYDVIATSRKTPTNLTKVPENNSSNKTEVFSPVWSESERSDVDPDGHEADTEGLPTDEYSFHKYTSLLHAEGKGRLGFSKPKSRARGARYVSRLPRPVPKR